MSKQKNEFLLIEKSKTQELINFLSEIPFKYANPIISEFMKLSSLEVYLVENKYIKEKNKYIQEKNIQKGNINNQ